MKIKQADQRVTDELLLDLRLKKIWCILELSGCSACELPSCILGISHLMSLVGSGEPSHYEVRMVETRFSFYALLHLVCVCVCVCVCMAQATSINT